MASTHIRVTPHRQITRHEQKRAEHRQTHQEHRGEELSKHRVTGRHNIHGGTHPVKVSHHSGSHVSNPNVVHHHAVDHSEKTTAAIEKERKKSSVLSAIKRAAINTVKNNKTSKNAPKNTPKPVKKTTPSKTTPGIAPHSGLTGAGSAIGNAIGTGTSSKPSYTPHQPYRSPGHAGIDFGTYGTPYYQNPESNTPGQLMANHAYATGNRTNTNADSSLNEHDPQWSGQIHIAKPSWWPDWAWPAGGYQ